MKKLLLAILTLLAVSCVKMSSVHKSELCPIVFETFDAASTKASKTLQLGGDLNFSAYLSAGGKSADDALPFFAYDEKCSRKVGGIYFSEKLFPPVDFNVFEKARFYLYGPSSATGLSLSPSTLAGPPYIDYAVPSDQSQQTDLIFGKSKEYSALDCPSDGLPGTGRLSRVSAILSHILACVSFQTDSAGISSATLNSLTIKGAYSSGRFLCGKEEWTDLSDRTVTFSINPDVQLNGKPFQRLLCSENGTTFMMLPQTLPSDAVIEVGITDADGDKVYTASIGGHIWKAGFDAVYSLHLDRPEGDIGILPYIPGGDQEEIL